MNPRQLYALQNACFDLEEATRNDFQDVVRLPSGAAVLSYLTVELFRTDKGASVEAKKAAPLERPLVMGPARWHVAVMIMNPRSTTVARLEQLPLKLHAELKTLAARLLIGVGRDPTDLHPMGIAWHAYRLTRPEEMGRILDRVDPALVTPPPVGGDLVVVGGPLPRNLADAEGEAADAARDAGEKPAGEDEPA